MKKKSASQSAFFKLRVLVAVLLCFAAITLVLFAFGKASAQPRPPAQNPQPVIRAQYLGVMPVVKFAISPPLSAGLPTLGASMPANGSTAPQVQRQNPYSDAWLAANHGKYDNIWTAEYETRLQKSAQTPGDLLPGLLSPLYGVDVRMSNGNVIGSKRSGGRRADPAEYVHRRLPRPGRDRWPGAGHVVRLPHQRQWRCLYRSPGAAAGDTYADANAKSNGYTNTFSYNTTIPDAYALDT
jgi:hypothetical protein